MYSPFKEGLRPNVQKTNKVDGLFLILFGPLILKIVSPLDPHSLIARRNPVWVSLSFPVFESAHFYSPGGDSKGGLVDCCKPLCPRPLKSQPLPHYGGTFQNEHGALEIYISWILNKTYLPRALPKNCSTPINSQEIAGIQMSMTINMSQSGLGSPIIKISFPTKLKFKLISALSANIYS